MHSRCGICGASLQEGDVQPEALCVRCSTCGGIYGLLRSEAEALLARAGRVPPATGIGRTDRPVAKAAVSPQRVDDGWELVREGDVLHVSWSWGGDPVSICMNALMAIGFGGLGLAGLLGEFEVPARQALVPWSFLVMSLFLGYEVLLRLVNRTSVEASPRTGISVRHGPLPWFVLPSVVEARDLYQLYGQKCAELVRGRIRQVYQLRVLCRDGRSRKLVSKELSAEQVLFLERTLEAHLGVRDAPVPGELKAESVS